MNITPRYSVCVPAGDKWVELSSHRTESRGRTAHSLQLVTDPDAALWDWSTGTIIAPSSTGGTE